MDLFDELHIVLDHNVNQFFVARLLRIPSQFGARLRRVAKQLLNLCGAEIFRIYFDEYAPCAALDAFLFDTFALPINGNASFCEG